MHAPVLFFPYLPPHYPEKFLSTSYPFQKSMFYGCVFNRIRLFRRVYGCILGFGFNAYLTSYVMIVLIYACYIDNCLKKRNIQCLWSYLYV